MRAHLVDQLVDDLAIHELQRLLAALDQSHLNPERREHRRVLDADDAGAHHDQGARQLADPDDVVTGDHDLAVGADARRRRRRRADGDDEALGGDGPRAVGVRDGDRVRSGEPRLAVDHRDVVTAQLIVDDLALTSRDALDAGQQVGGSGPVDRPPPAERREAEHRLTKRLARDRARVDAHAAETRLPLDHRDPTAELGRLHGGALAGGPAADADQAEVVAHGSKWRRSACAASTSVTRRRSARWRKNAAALPLVISRTAAETWK